jgi:quercetin dioxygenase-like cupin family protein
MVSRTNPPNAASIHSALAAEREGGGNRVQTWDVSSLELEPHQPQVLRSDEEGRAIVINLPAGEELQEHQVHERAWIVVLDGQIELEGPDGGVVKGSAGLLAHTPPNERHEVRAVTDSRLLLLLLPWPGAGHPSLRATEGERSSQ